MAFSYPQSPQPQPYMPPPYGPPQGPPGWQPVPPAPPSGNAQPANASPAKGNTESLALLMLVILLHVLVNVYWLQKDNHLIHLDEAHHMKRAAAYYDALFPQEAAGIFQRMIAALDIESPYPPLSHIGGAVAIRLMGNEPDAIALTNTAAFVLMLLGVYALGRLGMSPRNAFLAALTTSFIPMLYAGSRYFMPEALLCAIILWSLFALMKADRFRNGGWAAGFGLLVGLAFLTKQSAFLYLAVPAIFMALWGMGESAFAPSGKRRSELGRRLFHGLLCLAIIIGVSSWWYVRHVEYLHTWWSTQRNTEMDLWQPAIASRMGFFMPDAVESPELRIALDPAISETPNLPSPAPQRPAEPILTPYLREGSAYPVLMLNEALFAPLAILALAGLPFILLKRNRKILALLLLLWVFGAWLLFTGLFAVRSPRFLYCVAPAAAFLCVYALDAIPRTRLRRTAWAIFGLILAVQYVNLSFFALGPAARLEAPWLQDHPEVMARSNAGLTLCKAEIQAGNYVLHSPKPEQNIAQCVFERMAENEKIRKSAEGAAAWYQIVSATPSRLGLDFYEQFYSGAATGETHRPFAAIKWESHTPEETQPELSETEYIIVKQALNADYIHSLEEQAAFFRPYGFQSIMNLAYEGYGRSAPGYVHILAKKDMPQANHITNIFDLYDLLERDGRNWILTDEERKAAEQLYAQQVQSYSTIQPLSPLVNLLGIHVEPTAEDWHVLRLIIHAGNNIGAGYGIWLRATPHPEDRPKLFGSHQSEPAITWDFMPHPPSEQWKRNQALILSRPTMAKPARYRLEIGLFTEGHAERPAELVQTDWVNFTTVKR